MIVVESALYTYLVHKEYKIAERAPVNDGGKDEQEETETESEPTTQPKARAKAEPAPNMRDGERLRGELDEWIE
jgi:hypothetical protein